MKSYEEKFDYESLRNLPQSLPNITYPVFYEELVWLVNNEDFLKEVQKLREKWGISKPYSKPKLQVGEYWGRVILDNLELVPDATIIAKHCKIYREKYKLPLIEAIISFTLYDSFTTYIADARFLHQKEISPVSHIEFNNTDEQVKFTLSFPVGTKLKSLIKEVRTRWKDIEELTKLNKKTERLNPSRSILRDYFILYLTHKKGAKITNIKKFYKIHMEENSISYAIRRIERNIKQSFR